MKWVVVGDSQAEGLLYPNALPAILGADLIGLHDRRGWSSRRLLDDGAIDEAASHAARDGAKLVIVAGGNDPIPDTSEKLRLYKNTLLEILRQLSDISARAHAPLSVTWFGPVYALHEYDAVQHPQIAAAQRAIFGSSEARAALASAPGSRVSFRWVDSQPLTRDLARVENVHLTADGYRTYAERVVRAAGGGGGGLLGLALLAGAGYAGWRFWKRRR